MTIQLKRQSHPGAPACIVLMLLMAPFLLGVLPTTRFVEEQIDIYVNPSYIRVKGSYVYKNPFPFPVLQGLNIPFHVDADHAPPVSITAHELSPRLKVIPLRYLLGRHRFDLNFKPLEQKVVEVSYRQQTPKQNARYILKTTQPWKLPLVKGIYKIHLNGARLVNSNYPLDRESRHVFEFRRKDFMPEKDWDFSWEKSNENREDHPLSNADALVGGHPTGVGQLRARAARLPS